MHQHICENEVPVEQLGEQIAEVAAHIHAATHRMLKLLAEFDSREGWGGGGFRSCAHWLSWRTGIELSTAREKVRVANALHEFPATSKALEQGEISFSKARAITRVGEPTFDEPLVDVAKSATTAQVERIVRTYQQVTRNADEDQSLADKQEAERYLNLRTDENGMVRIDGRLTPEVGARLVKALEQAERELATGMSHSDVAAIPVAARRADALGWVANAAMSPGADGAQPDERYQVVIHVDEQCRGTPAADDGLNVSAETRRRLTCAASSITMTHADDGSVLDVGRKTRRINAAMRRALKTRDQCCQFPGCDHTRYVEAHHIQHWADGGKTSLDNLLTLCTRHHTAVHEGGVSVERTPDGAIAFRSRSGRVLDAAPKMPAASSRIEARYDLKNVSAETLSVWTGDRLDLDYAIEGLLELAAM